MNLDFLKRITGGLFLLTTEFNGIKNGCIINNCMEVSTNPSCISISVMKNSYTNELIEKSKKFAISILNTDVSSEMVKNQLDSLYENVALWEMLISFKIFQQLWIKIMFLM